MTIKHICVIINISKKEEKQLICILLYNTVYDFMIKVYETKRKGLKKIILEVNENRVILEKPRIQPFNEYKYTGAEDILYFYYDMTIMENTNYSVSSLSKEEQDRYLDEEDNRNPVWVKKTSVNVYEFGIIADVENFIDEILKFDIDKEGTRTYFWERDPKTNKRTRSKTDYECSHTFELAGMCDEDNIYITKYCRHFDCAYNPKTDKNEEKYVEFYKVFIGCGDNQMKANITGIIFDADEEDLLEIKKWANMFMEYAGEETIKGINNMYKKEEDSYYYPYFLKKHLEEKYPEDVPKLREIYPQLYEISYVIEEYYKYVKRQKIKDPITLKREGTVYTAQYFLDKGMKDYEAFIELSKKYYP